MRFILIFELHNNYLKFSIDNNLIKTFDVKFGDIRSYEKINDFKSLK